MMNVNLVLSPQEQADLEHRAAAIGADLSLFIQNLLREKLEERSDSPEAEMTYEELQKDFRSWIADQPSRNPQFDDSRESIYR